MAQQWLEPFGWIVVFAGIVSGVHAFSVTLTFTLALWFFVSGALRLLAAWHEQGTPSAWIIGSGGTLTLALGFLIASSLSSSAGWAIGLLVGINVIFSGVQAMVLARMLKSV